MAARFAVLALAGLFLASNPAQAQDESSQAPNPFAPSESGGAPPPPQTQQPAQPQCVPNCRDGFICVNGGCVSACNPPCGAGEQCVGQGICQPMAAQSPPGQAQQAPPVGQVQQAPPPVAQPGVAQAPPAAVTSGPPQDRQQQRREVRSRVRIGIHIGWSYQMLRVEGVTQTTYDPSSDWAVDRDNVPAHINSTVPGIGLQIRGAAGLYFGWSIRAYANFAISPNIRVAYPCMGDRWCGDVSQDYGTRVFAGIMVDGTVRLYLGRFFFGAGFFGGYTTLLGNNDDVSRSTGQGGGLGELGWLSGGQERIEIAFRGGGGKGVQGQFQLAISIAFN